MDEYISREALIKATKKAIKENNNVGYAMIDNDFLDLITDAPAEDVAEVKHGKWIKEKEGYRCPYCIGWWWKSNDVPEAFKYCPNCGAKMDGDDNAE